MTRVASYRLALPLAEQIAHARLGKMAWAWLQKHAELAVLTLVPVAFGNEADARADAERALFRLKAVGVDIVSIGARYGKEATAALEKLFTWDPVYDLPKTIPKLGPSWHPETLTRPRLIGSGKALPTSALDTIGTMLAFSPLKPPYAGIAQVKEACDARSLAEFSWDMARGWEHAGHKKKEIWMLMSMVHFADDEVVRRMTPGVRHGLRGPGARDHRHRRGAHGDGDDRRAHAVAGKRLDARWSHREDPRARSRGARA